MAKRRPSPKALARMHEVADHAATQQYWLLREAQPGVPLMPWEVERWQALEQMRVVLPTGDSHG